MVYIRSEEHHDFFNISITYLNYSEISDIGKICQVWQPPVFESNFEDITTFAWVCIISMYLYLVDIWVSVMISICNNNGNH